MSLKRSSNKSSQNLEIEPLLYAASEEPDNLLYDPVNNPNGQTAREHMFDGFTILYHLSKGNTLYSSDSVPTAQSFTLAEGRAIEAENRMIINDKQQMLGHTKRRSGSTKKIGGRMKTTNGRTRKMMKTRSGSTRKSNAPSRGSTNVGGGRRSRKSK
jgi:hypothetical protein